VTFGTAFTGYLPVKGVMLPMGYDTVIPKHYRANI